jgi:hypothetical protein
MDKICLLFLKFVAMCCSRFEIDQAWEIIGAIYFTENEFGPADEMCFDSWQKANTNTARGDLTWSCPGGSFL